MATRIEKSYYPMNAKPVGHCLIINNVEFSGRVDKRTGSDIDAHELVKLFRDFLNFKVELKRNVTKSGLEKILSVYQNKDHSCFDAFFMIILSHGDEGDIIYTSDSLPVKLNNISKYFSAKECPSLSGKPKVFIIQACRGPEHNKIVSLDQKPDHQSRKILHDDSPLISRHRRPGEVPADEADTLYAYATIDNHTALRDSRTGSWFIQELVQVIRKHAHNTHMLDILTIVNDCVSNQYESENEVQVTPTKNSLGKLLFLSPNPPTDVVTHSSGITKGIVATPPKRAPFHRLFSSPVLSTNGTCVGDHSPISRQASLPSTCDSFEYMVTPQVPHELEPSSRCSSKTLSVTSQAGSHSPESDNKPTSQAGSYSPESDNKPTSQAGSHSPESDNKPMKSIHSLSLSAFSLTSRDGGGGLLMKTHTEKGAFGYLKELTVTSSGMTYHCSQYGVTLIIPEGTIEDSATVWLGASLYSDKFHFGDYVPVTPIVWVYINQKLMKPVELYLPHHVNDNDSATKSRLTLLTASDESFPKVSFQVAGEDFIMEVQSGLCRIKCDHFCSSCVAINMTKDEKIHKIYMIAMAMRQESNSFTYQFCIFPSQMACKKLVEEQCSKSGLTLNCFECIEFDNGQVTVDFDPDQVAGWKRDQDGFFTDNKISEEKANYFEVMGCKDRPVTEQDIEKLEVMQETLLYPPRLCFKFHCIDIHVAQTETQVKAIIKGGSDIPLQLNINLSLTDLIPTSPVNITPENLPHNISLKSKIFAKILRVVVKGIKEENEWFYFGLALGLSISQLHSIEKNYCTEKCAREVLIEWKSQNETSSCNWKPVVDALREIGFDKLADQVESCLKEPEEATANSGGQSDTNDGQTHSQSQTTGLSITDLNEVMETLKEVHFGAAKWNDLGLSLGIYQTNLDVISDERGDSNLYLRKTIELWLKRQDKVNEKGGATWENLIKAVKSTGDNAAANRLREKLNLIS